MYFFALIAAEYDGTVAHDGTVDGETITALQRLKETGRKLVLVTGRELPDLKRVFPNLALFDRVVAENGALIYNPGDRGGAHARAAAARSVRRSPAAARCRAAFRRPRHRRDLGAARDDGARGDTRARAGAADHLQQGRRHGAAGRASTRLPGWRPRSRSCELSPHNVVGVGDAENDHAFLRACGCAAAVANALPMLKETADIRLAGDHGAGVARADRHDLPRRRPDHPAGTSLAWRVGALRDGRLAFIEPHRGSVLIAGRSGIGKSTLATALTERMTEKVFEFCIFDPEGDYDELDNAIALGDGKTPPQAEEASQLLQKPTSTSTSNTQALDVEERPHFSRDLLPDVGRCVPERVDRIGSSSTRPTTCFHRRAAIFRNYCRKSSRRRSSLPFTPKPSLRMRCAPWRSSLRWASGRPKSSPHFAKPPTCKFRPPCLGLPRMKC